MKITHASYAAVALTLALTGTHSTWAVPPAGNRSMTISLADLNLETSQGRVEARARVEAVARRLCESVADMHDRSRHENYLRCVDASLSAAMQQLDRLPTMLASQENDRPPQAR